MADRINTIKRLAQLTAGAGAADIALMFEQAAVEKMPDNIDNIELVAETKEFIQKNDEVLPAVLLLSAIEIRRLGLLPREIQYVTDGIGTVAALRLIESLIDRF